MVETLNNSRRRHAGVFTFEDKQVDGSLARPKCTGRGYEAMKHSSSHMTQLVGPDAEQTCLSRGSTIGACDGKRLNDASVDEYDGEYFYGSTMFSCSECIFRQDSRMNMENRLRLKGSIEVTTAQ